MTVQQKIWFDWIQPIRRKAAARRTDPATSHDAARRVELGKAERQRRLIKHWLGVYGPMTCDEMGKKIFDSVAEEPIGKIDAGKRITEIDGIAPTGEKRNGFRVWGMA